MPSTRQVCGWARGAAACWMAAAIAASPGASQAPNPDVSEKALVAAAAAYVEEYQKNFAFLIADEIYTQSLFGANARTRDTTIISSGSQVTQTRLMKSELFLTYLPADREWIAVRDVLEVDSVPITGREDLRQLLSRSENMRGLTSQLVARNSRYNIGRVERNFNEPTLPLLLLERKRIGGVKFSRRQVFREGQVTLATLSFAERDETLVSSPRGPIPAKGEFLIEAGTGIVRRTLFELATAGTKVKLETTYERDEKLNVWLPATFTERYETDGMMRELILCDAKYTNYRRFEVTARIK